MGREGRRKATACLWFSESFSKFRREPLSQTLSSLAHLSPRNGLLSIPATFSHWPGADHEKCGQQLGLEADYASCSRRSERHIPLAVTDNYLHGLG